MTRVALVWLVFVTLAALAGPAVLDYGFGLTVAQQRLDRVLEGPSGEHPLGTDLLGRDLLARLVHGGRISLTLAILATLLTALIGVIYGAVAGYAGGRVDELMMRAVDLLYSLPDIMLVVMLLALFERSLTLLFVALGAVSWLTIARIVRGQVLRLKQEAFVESARALGAPEWSILVHHVIPNTLGPVIAYASVTVPAVMVNEAFLSFLGLGVQPPTPSWGGLVSEGAQAMSVHPMLIVAPAVAIAVTLFSFSIVADALRLRWAGEGRA